MTKRTVDKPDPAARMQPPLDPITGMPLYPAATMPPAIAPPNTSPPPPIVQPAIAPHPDGALPLTTIGRVEEDQT
jgi:hypothetical protein